MHAYAPSPEQAISEQPADQLSREQQILGAFQGNIQPVREPLSYRLGILVGAIVMVLLPLLYIGIIALVGYAVYYHMVHNTMLLSRTINLVTLLLYFAPLVVGGILVLFLCKPLLARPDRYSKPEPLERQSEPLLFAFVDRICDAVQAPRPTQIVVDCAVNASASFRRGFLSMLGHDLVLTIGMPLVAGMTTRQLAGVLAHEFGHFSQGAGMRLSYIIRSISGWFTRVVYQRDEWDSRLVQWSEELDWRVSWMFYLARLFVWLTRKVLWALMMLGYAVCTFLMRQMEYDADRHQTRLVGGDVFEATMRDLIALGVAARWANHDLGEFYREGRLGDNLPQLILHNRTLFTSDVHSQVNQVITESTTKPFDTHPAFKDRIANAKRERATPIFQLELPAALLFSDFDRLCKNVTWEYYYDIFGDKLKPTSIHPVHTLLERQAADQELFKALHRFLQGPFIGDRPLQLSSWHLNAPADPAPLIQELRAAREQTLQGRAQYNHDYDNYDTGRPAVREELEPNLRSFEQLVERRLLAGIQLLYAPTIASSLTQAETWQKTAQRLLPTLKLLNDQVRPIVDLAENNRVMAQLLQRLSHNYEDPSTIRSIQRQLDVNSRQLLDLRSLLERTAYPFSHATEGISIGKFALAELPDPSNPGQLHYATGRFIDSVTRLRAQMTGQLCLIVEQVELALGLEPLPMPTRTPAAEETSASTP